jgi:hypothetical protein
LFKVDIDDYDVVVLPSPVVVGFVKCSFP